MTTISKPNKDYYEKVLTFSGKEGRPSRRAQIQDFEEAEEHEMKWIIKHATE